MCQSGDGAAAEVFGAVVVGDVGVLQLKDILETDASRRPGKEIVCRIGTIVKVRGTSSTPIYAAEDGVAYFREMLLTLTGNVANHERTSLR